MSNELEQLRQAYARKLVKQKQEVERIATHGCIPTDEKLIKHMAALVLFEIAIWEQSEEFRKSLNDASG
jgi:hypothetical protein